MSQFTGQLFLRSFSPAEIQAAGGDVQLYEVTQDFPFESDTFGKTIVVPAGLVTDFASIPRAVWTLLDPEDPVIAWPSVIHDYLYTCHGTLPDGTTYTRQMADAVLREGMETCGADSLLREAVYDAVEEFGGSHWK